MLKDFENIFFHGFSTYISKTQENITKKYTSILLSTPKNVSPRGTCGAEYTVNSY